MPLHTLNLSEELTQPSAPTNHEDDESDSGKYMMFQRSDDEGAVDADDNNKKSITEEIDDDTCASHHIIPNTPDREDYWRRSISMRGRNGGLYRHPVLTSRQHCPAPLRMTSWGSMNEHKDYADTQRDDTNVITPAAKGNHSQSGQKHLIHQKVFIYPPSSPIKAGPFINDDPTEEGDGKGDSNGFEGGEEWLPPQSTKSLRQASSSSISVKTARNVKDLTKVNEEDLSLEPTVMLRPQFVRQSRDAPSQDTLAVLHRPSLVVDSSQSHDSSEGSSKRSSGRRVQVDEREQETEWKTPSLVSHSKSIESGASNEWDPSRTAPESHLPVKTPDRAKISTKQPPTTIRYNPAPPHAMHYPPYHQGYPVFEHPPSVHAHPGTPVHYHPAYGIPQFSPDRQYLPNQREWHPPRTPSYPPRSAGYNQSHTTGYPYTSPMHYPQRHPAHSSSREINKKEAEDDPHPLLKDYNPDEDGIRPQFRMMKKVPSTRFIADDNQPNGPCRRKRRRRNPEEKLASAAIMAAAAAAAAAKALERKEKLAEGEVDDEVEIEKDDFSDDGSKSISSGDDEDIPAAKRAAIASAVALRAAAGGPPLRPPKAAAEIAFDISDPPLEPIQPPSSYAVLESASLMTENDVLCGRGGGTNSQMGNRRYRALVRDFQPTYLMARRREKPLMARSIVLIVRHRGGRFLRRDDSDGRLYEVGDEKAEAKTSQALREGLDVRATKTAANTLLGTDSEKKLKRAVPSLTSIKDKVTKSNVDYDSDSEGSSSSKGPSVHRKMSTQRPVNVPPQLPAQPGSEYHYPSHPRYEDPYYHGYYPHFNYGPYSATGYHHQLPYQFIPPIYGPAHPPSQRYGDHHEPPAISTQASGKKERTGLTPVRSRMQ